MNADPHNPDGGHGSLSVAGPAGDVHGAVTPELQDAPPIVENPVRVDGRAPSLSAPQEREVPDAMLPEENSGRLSVVGTTVSAHETAPGIGFFRVTRSAPGGQLSREDSTVATERRRWLARWRELKEADAEISMRAAAAIIGVPHIALWRVIRIAHQVEVSGVSLELRHLVPKRPAGRKPAKDIAEFALAIDTFRNTLETLYAATIGSASESAARGRRTGSVTTALLRIAEEACCPSVLAEQLRKGQQPASLVNYLRSRFTPEVEARIRGEKHYQLNGIVSRRDMTVRLADGRRAPITAGFLVELDDMSVNQPFFVEMPGGGWILSRQGLYARDVRSRRWLGVDLVARPREAYRAEDILRFLRRLMLDYGRFDVLRLERGIWASRCIKGYRITPDLDIVPDEWERPEASDEESAKLQRGLEAIGIQIDWAHDAHDKTIEGGFNHLQRVLATYTTDFVNIGRHAGEFELAAKRLRQARGEVRHPRELGFAPMDTLADRIVRAFTFVNSHKSAGTIPDGVWTSETTARPLPALQARDLAAFLPEVRERAILGGRVTLIVDGVSHDFRSDDFSALGHGYRVYVRWDPSEPQIGAAIYSRETSSANFRGYKDGDFICYASWEMPGPQLEVERCPAGLAAISTAELYGVEDDPKTAARNRQERFHRTAYRSLPKVGRPPVKVTEERDGRGQVARVASNNDATAPQLAQPKRNTIPLVTRSRVDDFVDLGSSRQRPAVSDDQVDAVEQLLDAAERPGRISRPVPVESDLEEMLDEL